MEEICKEADILVAGVGKALLVKPSWVKPGAVVIDCGINPIPDATKKSGQRLVGDVDPECAQVAGHLTPVPGGVGPMTVAMLLKNCCESAFKTVQRKLRIKYYYYNYYYYLYYYYYYYYSSAKSDLLEYGVSSVVFRLSRPV